MFTEDKNGKDYDGNEFDDACRECKICVILSIDSLEIKKNYEKYNIFELKI